MLTDLFGVLIFLPHVSPVPPGKPWAGHIIDAVLSICHFLVKLVSFVKSSGSTAPSRETLSLSTLKGICPVATTQCLKSCVHIRSELTRLGTSVTDHVHNPLPISNSGPHSSTGEARNHLFNCVSSHSPSILLLLCALPRHQF